jgi:uncharacterized protein (TIGR03435 family)
MMQTISDLIRAYVLNALWQAPLLLLATECTARLLKPARAAVVHRLWVSCLFAAVILPATPLLRKAQQQNASGNIAVLTQADAPTPDQTLQTTPEQKQFVIDAGPAPVVRVAREKPAPKLAWATIAARTLRAAYLLSVLFALAKLLWGLWRTRLLLRRATPAILTEDLQRVWTTCCAGFRLDGVRLLCSGSVTSPATLTFRKPAILLPENMPESDTAAMAAAFCHELAHVRRRDFLKNIVYELLTAPLFFHPAAHWMRRRMNETRELACDDLAAEVLDGRSAYASSLVRLAGTMSATAVVPGRALGVFEGNVLEKRIMNLIETKAKPAGWRVAVSVACGVLLLAASCVAGARYGLRPVFARVADAKPVTAIITPTISTEPPAAQTVKAPKPAAAEPAEPKTASAQTAPIAKPDSDSDLKRVQFKIGKTFFEPGDSIVIEDVRGTSDRITPGNIYEIKGRYTLTSQDGASLGASVTVSRETKNYPGLATDTTKIARGNGRFTLWMYMRDPGDPHLSFYPMGGGNSFAGIYFETEGPAFPSDGAGSIARASDFTASSSASAQPAPDSISDSISVTPDTSASRDISIHLTDRDLIADAPLDALIAYLYNIKPGLIYGLDSAIASQRFKITAHRTSSLNAAKDADYDANNKALLQNVLASKFQLGAHAQERVLDVYEVRLAEGGIKFQPADPNRAARGPDDKRLWCTNCSMKSFADVLADTTHRIVVDATGLNGGYDLRLTMPDHSRSHTGPQGYSQPDLQPFPGASQAALEASLQQELGLKLQPAQRPVKTLTIDHLELPAR